VEFEVETGFLLWCSFAVAHPSPLFDNLAEGGIFIFAEAREFGAAGEDIGGAGFGEALGVDEQIGVKRAVFRGRSEKPFTVK